MENLQLPENSTKKCALKEKMHKASSAKIFYSDLGEEDDYNLSDFFIATPENVNQS